MAEHRDSTAGGGQHNADLANDPNSLYYIDDQPAKYWDVGDFYIYERHVQDVVGEESTEGEDNRDVRRCFNCGSPDHAVSACPESYNHQLVSLSRQLFQFFKGDSGGEFFRIHELEEWKRQRIEWLESFEPGQIRGPLLREALGIQGEDTGKYVEWLSNIAIWGYPKGWVSHKDPRLRIWEIILERAESGVPDAEDSVPLFIYGEQDAPEEVILRPSAGLPSTEPSDDESKADSAEPIVLTRWVEYPETYFSSSRLPIYNGVSLPPVEGTVSEQNSTFTQERQALWNDITERTTLAFEEITPLLPPPPTSTPPPLPPSELCAPNSLRRLALVSEVVDDGELDMDLSDSD